MAQETINVGGTPNDGTGDPLRDAFTKANSNFTELYSTIRTTIPSSIIGSIGDVPGTIALEADFIYVCSGTFDGSTAIWTRAALSTWS
jgi:hypothetical protein